MTAARGRKKVRREFFVGRQKTPEVCCCLQQVSSGHALIKKHKAAALRCLWRIIVKGPVAKVSTRRLRADGGHIGIWAYAARVGVWRTAAGGGECMGGECMGAAQVHGRHRCTGAHAHGRTGARAARIRRWAYRRVSSAPTGAKAYASGASSPAGRSFLPPSSRLVKLSGLMGRA